MGGNVISIILSIAISIRGFMYFNNGNSTMGLILILVGVGGGIFKLYTMTQNKEEEE
jgi:hypothetical protein